MKKNKDLTEINLIFYVFGDDFNPELFTKHTKIKPTYSYKKGDAISNFSKNIKNSSKIVAKESVWEFSTDCIKTLFLEDVTNIFIEKFLKKISQIKTFITEHNLDAGIDIVVVINKKQVPALTLESKFLDIIHELNCDIDIDMYVN